MKTMNTASLLALALAVTTVCLATRAVARVQYRSGEFEGNEVPIAFVPLETGAAALDGSPYAYYLGAPETKTTRWTINIEGGGWCYNETLCAERAKTRLGTSTVLSKTTGWGCSFDYPPSYDTCNYLYFPYLDGASFSGYVEDPVPHGDQKLHFRGLRNLDATLDLMIQNHDMAEATEIIVMGGSAGGLSTFLHVDRIQRMFPKAKVRAKPVVGYFLDHGNFVGSSFSYPNWMNYIANMQNLTAGPSGALNSDCVADFPGNELYKCFMSPHMQAYIQTPFFMLNSRFDHWQMDNILQVPCIQQVKTCNETERAAIVAYGLSFLNVFDAIRREHQNGGFITSCICHGCPWSNITLPNRQQQQVYPEQLFWDWYSGKVTGPDAIVVDQRLPNGDGTLKNHECQPW